MKLGHLPMRFILAGIALVLPGAVLAQAPNIEGTYKLMSRTLPDGRVQRPTEAMGLMTYTKTHRNFNIMWKDASGKHFSLSIVSTYKLTSTEYGETLLFRVISDQIGGKEIVYDLSGKTQSSPVKMEGGRIQFKLPFEAPVLIFDRDKMTAATAGGPVAVWERVQ